MQRNYLTISILVTVLGVAFILLPATYTINLAPEEVTLWEDTMKAQLGPNGAFFSFNTGEHVVLSGVYPYVKVWSLDNISLNTTIILTGAGGGEFQMSDNPSEFV